MRRYESILIADPYLTEDELEVLVDKVKDFLAKEKGEDISIQHWGKRKLAYDIKKKPRGSYILLNYRGEPELIRKFEAPFRIDEKVFRCQTIRVDENELTQLKEEDDSLEDIN